MGAPTPSLAVREVRRSRLPGVMPMHARWAAAVAMRTEARSCALSLRCDPTDAARFGYHEPVPDRPV